MPAEIDPGSGSGTSAEDLDAGQSTSQSDVEMLLAAGDFATSRTVALAMLRGLADGK